MPLDGIPVHLGDLMGPAGNAFVVLGQVHESFRLTGNEDRWPEFHAAATAGDYANLLDTVDRWCEDLDGSIAEWRSYMKNAETWRNRPADQDG
jgi:hypothetical protein